jgi:hypothetical protein
MAALGAIGSLRAINRQITFRNNLNLQDGFDGGVLEISTDGGNTFLDILTLGTGVAGGYNGTVSTCCGNPLAGRQLSGNWRGQVCTVHRHRHLNLA